MPNFSEPTNLRLDGKVLSVILNGKGRKSSRLLMRAAILEVEIYLCSSYKEYGISYSSRVEEL
jgi:hypothetical protein